jgi:hypothetical protein
MGMAMAITTDSSNLTVLVLSFEKLDPDKHLEWQGVLSDRALTIHSDSF